MRKYQTEIQKALLILVSMISIQTVGFSQWITPEQACDDIDTLFIDIDNDGYGVDLSDWNKYWCNDAGDVVVPNGYAIQKGDEYPSDRLRFSASQLLTSGCTMPAACNYNEIATKEDGSCIFPLACQTCDFDGDSILADPIINKVPCDCDETTDPIQPLYEDALGHCGGECDSDTDEDGICDNLDPCTDNPANILDDCGNCVLNDTIGTYGYNVFTNERAPLGSDTVGAYTWTAANPSVLDSTGFCDCDSTKKLNSCYQCVLIEDLDLPCGDQSIITDTIPNSSYYLEILNVDSMGNGIPDHEDIEGCRLETACNFDSLATWGVTSLWCDTLDVCQVCGGDAVFINPANPSEGLADGRCSCESFPEYAKDCDGNCLNDDLPNDAYWNDFTTSDSPLASYVADSITNSTGNGICDELEVIGCTIETACNYDPSATLLGPFSCIMKDILNVCGGGCENDADDDGICDDDLDLDGNADDSCIGFFDDCGICISDSTNGSWFTLTDGSPCLQGSSLDCFIRSDPANPKCNCFGEKLDAIQVCGGTCPEDADNDEICDYLIQDGDTIVNDFNICIGITDEIGVCNGDCDVDVDDDDICDTEDTCLVGTGRIDDCDQCDGSNYFTLSDGSPCLEGTSPDCLNRSDLLETPTCNCAGDTLDAVFVCGGACLNDVDEDGICDDGGGDNCAGTVDECGICDGDGIPAENCNCFGDTLDALGVCGGPCLLDADNDMLCDLDIYNNVLDNCIGDTLDSCGVCGGPGPLPDCDCEPVINGECDCNGNVIDECGVCGGPGPSLGRDCDNNCLDDVDEDGICDLFDPLVWKVANPLETQVSDGILSVAVSEYLVDTAFQTLIDLHEAMAVNLDDGSLTGTSNRITIQDSVQNNGTLRVEGSAVFRKQVSGDGPMLVKGDVTVGADFKIAGVTFNNGGLESTNVQNSGALLVRGTTNVGQNLNVAQTASIRNLSEVVGNLNVHNGLFGGTFDNSGSRVNFAVNGNTGKVRMDGDVNVQSEIAVGQIGFLSNLLNVNRQSGTRVARTSGTLEANSSLDVKNNLIVNDSMFTVHGPTGMTRIAGNLVVDGNVVIRGSSLLKKSLRVTGTTFADGGMHTTNVNMSGDMVVDNDINVYTNTSVDGQTRLLRDLQVGSNFYLFDNQTASKKAKFTISPGVQVSTDGEIRGQQAHVDSMTVDYKLTINSDGLTVDGLSSVNGGIITGQSLFTSSDVLKLSGPTTLQDSLVLLGDFQGDGPVNIGKVSSSKYLDVNGLRVSGGLFSNPVSSNYDLTDDRKGALRVTSNSNSNEGVVSIRNSNSSGHGVKVQINKTVPNNDSEYVRFVTSNDVVIGRIEGETPGEHTNNLGWVADKTAIDAETFSSEATEVFAHANYIAAEIDRAMAITQQVAAVASVSFCSGFGWCVTLPVPSFIIAAATNLVLTEFIKEEAKTDWNNAKKALRRSREIRRIFDSNSNGSVTKVAAGGQMVGVAFASGSGDYAEYLPKLNPMQEMYPGQIVGIHQGKISFNTSNADNLFVISTQPIVLGNEPEFNSNEYEKAAFLGQVPVWVKGPVNKGDFILPSGNLDGIGIARSKNDVSAADISRLVGVAWESNYGDTLCQVIAAVGISDGIASVSQDLDNRLTALEDEVDELNSIIKSQMRGEKMTLYEAQMKGLIPPLIRPESEIQYLDKNQLTDKASFDYVTSDDIIMHEITDEAMEYAFDIATKEFRRITSGRSNVLKQIDRNPELKKVMLSELKQDINAYNDKFIENLDRYNSLNVLKPVTSSLTAINPIDEKDVQREEEKEKRKESQNKSTPKRN